jgi:hypothetical protein
LRNLEAGEGRALGRRAASKWGPKLALRKRRVWRA